MIITAQEVKSNSMLVNHFPNELICTKLDVWEKMAFNDCLGSDFYDLLIADLATYTTTDWNEDLTLTDDSYYVYEGVIYKYNNVEVVSGVDTPNCSDNWTYADKFTSPCYQKIWENGLKDYLATYIHFQVMPFGKNYLYNRGDSKGANETYLKEFATDRKIVQTMAAESLEILKNYIKCQHEDKEDTCDYTVISFISETCIDCTDDIGTVPRIAFGSSSKNRKYNVKIHY